MQNKSSYMKYSYQREVFTHLAPGYCKCINFNDYIFSIKVLNNNLLDIK